MITRPLTIFTLLLSLLLFNCTSDQYGFQTVDTPTSNEQTTEDPTENSDIDVASNESSNPDASDQQNNPVPTNTDQDDDGVTDLDDNCPSSANADQNDTDSDGIGDVCDPINNSSPTTPTPTPTPTTDTDNDGIDDSIDNCPLTINASQADLDGDGLGNHCDDDVDGDGVNNAVDNCKYVTNPTQLDTDSDGKGDVCDATPGTATSDADGDGIDDAIDNCVNHANPSQADLDGDGLGNHCDSDADGDGIENSVDNCVSVPNPSQNDADGDGLGNICDSDADGDSIPNSSDNCPQVANPTQQDSDSDGLGDACDSTPSGSGNTPTGTIIVTDPCLALNSLYLLPNSSCGEQTGGAFLNGFYTEMRRENSTGLSPVDPIESQFNRLKFQAASQVNRTGQANDHTQLSFESRKTVRARNDSFAGTQPNRNKYKVNYTVAKMNNRQADVAYISIDQDDRGSIKSVNVDNLGIGGYNRYAVLISGIDWQLADSNKFKKIKKLIADIRIQSSQRIDASKENIGRPNHSGNLRIEHTVDFDTPENPTVNYKVNIAIIGFNPNSVKHAHLEQTYGMSNEVISNPQSVQITGSNNQTGNKFMVGVSKIAFDLNISRNVGLLSFNINAGNHEITSGNRAEYTISHQVVANGSGLGLELQLRQTILSFPASDDLTEMSSHRFNGQSSNASENSSVSY